MNETARTCRMCGRPLTGRQARYCSRSCQVGGQNRDRARQARRAKRDAARKDSETD